MINDSIDTIIDLFLNREKIDDIPVNIETISQKYALVKYIKPPIPFDGITIKEKGKPHEIILYKENYPQRIKFTIAHELGHIIIPWHVGKIVDETIDNYEQSSGEYHEMEIEANRFAAGVLLPIEPIKKRIHTYFHKKKLPLADIIRKISELAEVSLQVTIYRLIKLFPRGCAFIFVNDENVVGQSGTSPGTYTRIPTSEDLFSLSIFKSVTFSHSKIERDFDSIHFFQFDEEVNWLEFEYIENPNWKKLLMDILSETFLDEKEIKKMYKSICSVIGGCSGIIRNKNFGFHTYANHLHERLVRKKYNWLVNNDKYFNFMSAKASDLFAKNKLKS